MPYRIIWTARAQRALRKFPLDIQTAIEAEVSTLAGQPRQPHRTEKIKTSGFGELKLRVGGYRVFYTISDVRQEVQITDVRKRDEKTYH